VRFNSVHDAPLEDGTAAGNRFTLSALQRAEDLARDLERQTNSVSVNAKIADALI
jgi:hypothetical protein